MQVTKAVHLVLPVAAFSLVLSPLTSPLTGPAAAAGGETRCHLVKEDILDPGLSLEGTSGTFLTPRPGTITCEGLINGLRPTGPGVFLEQGRYGTKDPDNCLAGEGHGIFSAIIPTEKGSQRVAAPFTFTFGDLPTHGGVIAGRLEGRGFSGTFDAIPVEGDCVARPVTKIYTMDDIVFSSTSAVWSS